jgi:signal transduction histidine kinase
VRARLFERFNREPGDADGHGLGLAIAHALTAAQGGALRLDEAAPGTRFVLELPRAEAPAPAAG